jgi:dihydroorotase
MEKAMPVLERMAKIGLPLCVHGEVTTPEVDIFDREKVFIETVLDPLRKRLPELKRDHGARHDENGIEYIKLREGNLAGSITTHHLIINRNAISGRRHSARITIACRSPSARSIARRCASAAVSGDARFFLGTDSAPACRSA